MLKLSDLDVQIRSDQISYSVVSNSLRTHESQHARPPCPSPTPGVHSDSRPLSQWCHRAISSSVVSLSSCSQSLPASESLPMSQLFAGPGHSTGVSGYKTFWGMIALFCWSFPSHNSWEYSFHFDEFAFSILCFGKDTFHKCATLQLATMFVI